MFISSSATALSLSRQAARSRFGITRIIRGQTQQRGIGKRGKSTSATTSTTSKSEPEFVRKSRLQRSDEFTKKTWLSDPSTYPIIVVLGGALVVCVGRCIQGFFFCHDVKVDRNRKNRIVRAVEEKDAAGMGQSFISRTFAPEDNSDPIYKKS